MSETADATTHYESPDEYTPSAIYYEILDELPYSTKQFFSNFSAENVDLFITKVLRLRSENLSPEDGATEWTDEAIIRDLYQVTYEDGRNGRTDSEAKQTAELYRIGKFLMDMGDGHGGLPF